eukprot:gene1704-1898_t
MLVIHTEVRLVVLRVIYSTGDDDNWQAAKIMMSMFGNLEPFEGGEFSSYNYFKPKVSEVAETYCFHQAVQNENESVFEYVNRLKHCAVHCNFGNFLPRALRDEFVRGVRNPTIKTKLLSADRTFDRAVQIAIADEAAQKEQAVPFAICEQYEKALDKLEKDGIIKKVEYSEWASPTVPIVKADGSLRICGDYSRTISKFSVLEKYPVPTIEELMGKLQGGKKFTKLDLSKAYHQLELTAKSEKFTTISMTKGLYQYNRLPFAVTSAVTIFQRTMENLLNHIPGCAKGIKLKKDKFDFMCDKVNYLGFVISSTGISPMPDKVNTIHKAKAPNNIAELQSFIGMANYLRQFIHNFADIMLPLYKLLRNDMNWRWGVEEQQAFVKIKASITSEQVLRHYNPSAPLVLQVDASSIGVGAVILQPDVGTLRPVAYTSRIPANAEKKYSQIKKESLGIVFGVPKFRQYLLGRHFILKTDHKPLITLCGEHNPIPILPDPVKVDAIKNAIERFIPYQATAPDVRPEPLSMSELPLSPWHTVHIDFCAQFPTGEYALVVIDALPRSPEVDIVSSTSAKVIAPKLQKIFTTHGLPTIIKSDNGPPFSGHEFYKFMKELGTKHKPSILLSPQGNGEVERFMKPFQKHCRFRKERLEEIYL